MRRGVGVRAALLAASVIGMIALPGVCGIASVASAAERYVVIVSGAAGSPELAEQHAAWRTSLVTALQDKLQMPAERVIVLIDKSTAAPAPGARPAAAPGSPGGSGITATILNPPGGRQNPGGGGAGTPGAPGSAGTPAATPAAADPAKTAEIDKRAIAATRDNVRATLTKLAQDMKLSLIHI